MTHDISFGKIWLNISHNLSCQIDAMDLAAESLERREKKREEILKAFQANATGRFKHWPFPITESTYILEYNTLKQDFIKHWKNGTRDFTELRREYVPESR